MIFDLVIDEQAFIRWHCISPKNGEFIVDFLSDISLTLVSSLHSILMFQISTVFSEQSGKESGLQSLIYLFILSN